MYFRQMQNKMQCPIIRIVVQIDPLQTNLTVYSMKKRVKFQLTSIDKEMIELFRHPNQHVFQRIKVLNLTTHAQASSPSVSKVKRFPSRIESSATSLNLSYRSSGKNGDNKMIKTCLSQALILLKAAQIQSMI